MAERRLPIVEQVEAAMADLKHCDGHHEKESPHTCPYLSELKNDDSLCTCCDECAYHCSQETA